MEQPSFFCKLGVLSRSDGSVMLCEGNLKFNLIILRKSNKLVLFTGETTVIVGLNGPVEVKTQKLLIDKASVECSYRPKSGLPCTFISNSRNSLIVHSLF